MQTNTMPSRFNTFTVSMMLISLAIGFFLNYWSSKLANDKLLAQLQGQYDAILLAQQTARGGESELLEKKKSDLQAQIKILKTKKS